MAAQPPRQGTQQLAVKQGKKIIKIMEHYGAGPGILEQAKDLLTGTSAKVRWQGHRSEPFDVIWGVQQGSPASTCGPRDHGAACRRQRRGGTAAQSLAARQGWDTAEDHVLQDRSADGAPEQRILYGAES